MVNEWTRDDLPSLLDVLGDITTYERSEGAAAYRTTALAHLNAHHPKPTPGPLSSAADCVLDAEDRASAAKSEVALWRRAHELAERERDQARRERDAAVERAEVAERERDHGLMEIAEFREELVGAHARAEQAEAAYARCSHKNERLADENDYLTERATSAVSRADIEKALDTGIRGTTDGGLIDQDTSVPSGECVRLAVDAVCDLLGIEAERAVDPVEAKARELWEVARFEDGDEWPGLLQVERDCYRRMASHVLGREADQ